MTQTIELAAFGERLAPLRLRSPEALRAVEHSLSRDGQLMAIACYRHADAIEVVDGFKRLIGARKLGWSALRAEIHGVGGPWAKLLLWRSNAGHELTPLEEAWLVRALYRDDRLTQPQIAQLFGRDKSWVCRRLVLAEGLAETVEASVRLGLVSATAAREVARLPRGNQEACAQVIARRGLTTRQAALLVDRLLTAPDEQIRSALLTEAEQMRPPPPPDRHRARPTPSEAIVSDAAALSYRATRLHARLLERPLTGIGAPAQAIVVQRLHELTGVIAALHATLVAVTGPARSVQEVAHDA
jgi:ParB-like chromosome segregation protein Spo0J